MTPLAQAQHFVRAPDWTWYIVPYFFLAGLAGGSYVIATLLRLWGDRRDEPARFGSLRPVRQWIESVIDTLKGQLGLEQHGGRTPAGVHTRVVQRLLAWPPASGSTGSWAWSHTARSSPTTTKPIPPQSESII